MRSIQEFKHLTIGQIRFFAHKLNEYEALAAKTRELNQRLRAQQEQEQD